MRCARLSFSPSPPVIATAAASTPAGATEIDQAIGLCNANPNCRIISQNGGGATLCVKGKRTDCDKTVECTAPGKGGCAVFSKGKQQVLRGNVGMVLSHAGSKPVTIKSAGVTSGRGGAPKLVRDDRTDPIVRDHRGQSVRVEGRP